MFLNACLNNGLKIFAMPEYIATLTEERASSWNNGYDEKYIKDQGVLYRTLSRRWWRLLCLQDAVRRCRSYNMEWKTTYRMMIDTEKFGVIHLFKIDIVAPLKIGGTAI